MVFYSLINLFIFIFQHHIYLFIYLFIYLYAICLPLFFCVALDVNILLHEFLNISYLIDVDRTPTQQKCFISFIYFFFDKQKAIFQKKKQTFDSLQWQSTYSLALTS
jgi:hypothetical protein